MPGDADLEDLTILDPGRCADNGIDPRVGGRVVSIDPSTRRVELAGAAGLVLDPVHGGVAVDADCRTSAGGIFAAFYLAEGRVHAAFAVERGGDVPVARELISRGLPVTEAALADEDTDLFELLDTVPAPRESDA